MASVLAALVALVLAGPADGAGRVGALRARNAALAAESRQALLDLYALDYELDHARSRLATLEAAAGRVRNERAAATVQLGVARRTLADSQRQLGQQVRELYVEGAPDPLAVLFGASSLDELIASYDGLNRAANATASVVAEASSARGQVLALGRVLAARQAQLDGLAAQAAAREATLAAARTDRSRLLARLRTEQRLNDDQIGRLEAQARAAEARAQLATIRVQADSSVLSFGAQAPLRDSPPPPPPPSQQPPAGTTSSTLVVVSTGYDLKGTTATGLAAGPGIAAVDPTVIPLGTQMSIPGYGDAVAADTGSAIRGNRIDLWFPTRKQALLWGWRTLTVTLH